jgi:hypothetical protein
MKWSKVKSINRLLKIFRSEFCRMKTSLLRGIRTFLKGYNNQISSINSTLINWCKIKIKSKICYLLLANLYRWKCRIFATLKHLFYTRTKFQHSSSRFFGAKKILSRFLSFTRSCFKESRHKLKEPFNWTLYAIEIQDKSMNWKKIKKSFSNFKNNFFKRLHTKTLGLCKNSLNQPQSTFN